MATATVAHTTLADFPAGEKVRFGGFIYDVKAQHQGQTEMFAPHLGKVVTWPSCNAAEKAIIPTEEQAAAQAETERLATTENAYIFDVTWHVEDFDDVPEGSLCCNMSYRRADGSGPGRQSVIYRADGKVLDVVDWG